jgi:hypothetical protein
VNPVNPLRHVLHGSAGLLGDAFELFFGETAGAGEIAFDDVLGHGKWGNDGGRYTTDAGRAHRAGHLNHA